MRNRLAIALAAWLIGVSTSLAQSPNCDDPVKPPLIPVPTGPGTPAPCCPTPLDEYGKPLDYDRSLLYLPEQNPRTAHPFESRPRDERATWGRAAGLIGQTQSFEPVGLLAGQPSLAPRWRAGLDAEAGVWWNADRSIGAEIGATYLAAGTATSAAGDLATRFFTGQGTYRQTVGKIGKIKMDMFAGYRFASVSEDYNLDRATNYFNGGTFGMGGEYRYGPWSADVRATVALGVTFADRSLNGMNVSDRTFATMPELALSLGREILDGGRVFLGYRFASLNHIARPQMANGEWSSFWVQGVMVGLDWWF
ncbi:MAG: BBP7 family outer membrane beta-barrel protein [Gemmataceae bacterium]